MKTRIVYISNLDIISNNNNNNNSNNVSGGDDHTSKWLNRLPIEFRSFRFPLWEGPNSDLVMIDFFVIFLYSYRKMPGPILPDLRCSPNGVIVI
jgi:hypothetical protein